MNRYPFGVTKGPWRQFLIAWAEMMQTALKTTQTVLYYANILSPVWFFLPQQNKWSPVWNDQDLSKARKTRGMVTDHNIVKQISNLSNKLWLCHARNIYAWMFSVSSVNNTSSFFFFFSPNWNPINCNHLKVYYTEFRASKKCQVKAPKGSVAQLNRQISSHLKWLTWEHSALFMPF